MSERELHKARLLAAGKGSKSGGGGGPSASSLPQNGSQAAGVAPPPQQQQQQTPSQAAAAALQTEDAQMKRFLQRLQLERDDSRPGSAITGPTVPTALSRRILHRQGVGYKDSTVAAIASAAADRFLATVLQQAVTCRDQRLKGAEMARRAAAERKRHKRQYQEDADDRRRRREEREKQREQYNLAAIETADALKKKSAAAKDPSKKGDVETASMASGSTKSKAKKKKKSAADSTSANGNKRKAKYPLSDDEASYDSLDEEEDYYNNYYDDEDDIDTDSDEEDDETMTILDLARPLAAWDFQIDGKLGMKPAAIHEDKDREGEFAVDGIADDPAGGTLSDLNQVAPVTTNGVDGAAAAVPTAEGGAVGNQSAHFASKQPNDASPTDMKKAPPPSQKQYYLPVTGAQANSQGPR